MNKKIAVIDIGSNSVRMQISEIQEGKRFRVLLDEKDTVRLGEEVFEKGYFSNEGMERALRTMDKFRQIIDHQGVDHIRAVATAGFREAANQEELVKYLFYEANIPVEVISGAEEARLIALGVFSNFELENKNALIVDIGGGSAELIVGNKDQVFDVKSSSLGCTRLTRYFLKSNPVKAYEVELLEQHIDEIIKRTKNNNQKVDIIIGTGGSLTNLTEIIYKMNKKKTNTISRDVTLQQVLDLNEELIKRNYDERILLPGLEQKRVDIILSASKVIERIMKAYDLTTYTSLDKGLRDGLTIETISNLGIYFPYQKDNLLIKEQRIWEIGHKYRFEEKHALNVSTLSVKLFDSLKQAFGLKEKWKEYLKAASMLHDVGYYISYSKHHKHSQYLIENSEFVGFDEREVQIIANIARYHRKSMPKITHQSYRKLSILEKDIVMKMSAILRVGDALDRSHRESIHNFDVKINEESVLIKVYAPKEELLMEQEGVNIKSDMFERVFKKQVILETE